MTTTRQLSCAVLAGLACILLCNLGHLRAAETMTKEQVIAEGNKMALAEFARLKGDYRHRSWIHGAFWAGVVDLSKVSDEPKVREALEKFCTSRGVRKDVGVLQQHNHAGHGTDPHHADNFCVSQAFLDYYAKTKNEKVIADTKRLASEVADRILSKEAAAKAARFDELGAHEALTWTWIDALFMAAPVHARLTEVTGDPKYLNSMLVEWKRVSDRLYDTKEHLYYRDKGYLNKKTRNGKKMFWSRGNGWVMGAFAHALPYVPKDHPQRTWLVKQFKEMATKFAEIQQADGSWSPSLLDYKEFPYSEMSGTAFYCFAIAWGINNGILDEKTFRPVVEKAWAAMLAARREDGRLGYIQGVGAQPSSVSAGNSALYGVGAFLSAAAEISKMAPIKLPPKPALKSRR